MNKFLRVLFVLVIIAMSGAIIFQLFFPTYMGSHSGYGISVGWQREIGIWNVAVLVILIAVNLKYDWFYLRTVLLALIIGGLGIGTKTSGSEICTNPAFSTYSRAPPPFFAK